MFSHGDAVEVMRRTNCSSRELRQNMSNSHLQLEQRPSQGCLSGIWPAILLVGPGHISKRKSNNSTSMNAFPVHTVEANRHINSVHAD